jgi:phosphonate transport system substrate-binding protein
MAYQFTVSPDFNADQMAHWFIFNTWLQRALGEGFHLELHTDFQKLRQAIRDDQVDLIYANPFDAALLVREKGFLPVATVTDRSDETLIAAAADGSVQKVLDLKPGTRIASTDAPDVEMIGRIMLEPADLNTSNTKLTYEQNYVLVAKQVMQGKADVGFFLKGSFEKLSALVRSRLNPIATSHIYVVQHALLVGPKLWGKRDALLGQLVQMNQDPRNQRLLADLEFTAGWKEMSMEETEFMIDLMDTLVA